ncbi:hypothetical protein Aasi_1781 [Candidatus Amoebophilus asiaticus 5a2]|uniref:Uncharacterized protein n=2 Tax=Candidatus Amoebophilus asiaticus TaxID=281120 RepID=C3L407_AMOA5|nr:hypothetical protein Aasi_1781 [Candidatus Amoebophilus asiaticus 5a2]
MTNNKKENIPPVAVAHNAKKGLEFRDKFKRGRTEVGIKRAQQLSNREQIDEATIKKMYSYFARHQVDKRGQNFGNEENPSNGYIAWLLWGGDAGKEWSKQVREALADMQQKTGK